MSQKLDEKGRGEEEDENLLPQIITQEKLEEIMLKLAESDGALEVVDIIEEGIEKVIKVAGVSYRVSKDVLDILKSKAGKNIIKIRKFTKDKLGQIKEIREHLNKGELPINNFMESSYFEDLNPKERADAILFNFYFGGIDNFIRWNNLNKNIKAIQENPQNPKLIIKNGKEKKGALTFLKNELKDFEDKFDNPEKVFGAHLLVPLPGMMSMIPIIGWTPRLDQVTLYATAKARGKILKKKILYLKTEIERLEKSNENFEIEESREKEKIWGNEKFESEDGTKVDERILSFVILGMDIAKDKTIGKASEKALELHVAYKCLIDQEESAKENIKKLLATFIKSLEKTEEKELEKLLLESYTEVFRENRINIKFESLQDFMKNFEEEPEGIQEIMLERMKEKLEKISEKKVYKKNSLRAAFIILEMMTANFKSSLPESGKRETVMVKK